MTVNTVTFESRVTNPKSDVIAIYIGFLSGELKLYECNTNNQTIRVFTLDENDATIPAEKLEKAREDAGLAFCQVRVFQHPGYIEYFRSGAGGDKYKKQDFWVRKNPAQANYNLPSVA